VKLAPLAARLGWRRPRRVVYTCLFGYSEALNEVAVTDGATDFVCFTDDPELKSNLWRVELAPNPLLDPVRAAKRIKILAHRVLSGYDSSLYIDNVVRLKKPPRDLFEEYLDPSRSPFVCFRHPQRACVYQEADAVIAAGYDSAARVNAQMAHYRSLDYPAMNGLFKGAFLLRRHNDPMLAAVMETWFEQVLRHSYRDQLSMPVAFDHHKFEPSVIERDFMANDILEWPVVAGDRLPRDFDDMRYLELYPDVRAARIHPRKHFMHWGRAEGRVYK
jgi:hypothetical protein